MAKAKEKINPKQRLADFEAWMTTPAGQRVLTIEKHHVDTVLSKCFGYHVLQVGPIAPLDWFSVSHIAHRIYVQADSTPVIPLSPVKASFEELPFKTNSLDVVLLPHTLEVVADPERILEEAVRVLIPEGRVVIIGFNPYSLWGLWQKLYGKSLGLPANYPLLGQLRLRRALTTSGCEVTAYKTFAFRSPSGEAPHHGKLKMIELMGQMMLPYQGSVYVMQAKKRVSSLTPIGLSWQPPRVRKRNEVLLK